MSAQEVHAHKMAVSKARATAHLLAMPHDSTRSRLVQVSKHSPPLGFRSTLDSDTAEEVRPGCLHSALHAVPARCLTGLAATDCH
jgi:hypothetical protein